MSGAPREKWNSRTGFVLAAIGSAVGLGNMWRFSYLAAEHGGAAFVVLYLGFTLLVGVPVLLAAMALGRGARRSPIAALEHYGGRSWRGLGALFVVSGFVILAYYSVIAGWTFAYAISGLTGFGSDPAATFAEVSTGPDAVALSGIGNSLIGRPRPTRSSPSGPVQRHSASYQVSNSCRKIHWVQR